MGMNLQSELDPLLSKLWDAAQSSYTAAATAADPDNSNPAESLRGQQAFNAELTILQLRFSQYYSLDGLDLDAVADQFARQEDRWESPAGESVYCSVARAANDVNDVDLLIHTEQWDGEAARSFKLNVLNPFKDTAAVHALAAREMAIAAKALANGVERAKECVVWICKNAIERFGGGIGPGPLPGEEGHEGVAGWVAILADAAALFRAVTDPEAKLADSVLAATGYLAGIKAEAKSSSEKPIEIAYAPTPMGYIEQTWLALNNLDANIADLDEQINGGLENDLGTSGPFGSPNARIVRPGLDPSAYRKLDAKGTGEPIDVVVKSVVRLYYAGYQSLPAAADEYSAGVSACKEAHIAGIEDQFPRSAAKFNETVKQFGPLLSSVETDLTDSGKAIVAAAENYQAADQSEADNILALEHQIPSTDANYKKVYSAPWWLEP